MKIVIIIFSLILKLLIAGIGAFLMFSQDTGKEQCFCLLIMAIVLAIIEIIHIGGLIFMICDEKHVVCEEKQMEMKSLKIQLLKDSTFNDKNLKEIKIGDSQKEIYKIFCNTLVDL
jgi:hypothetical protein